MTVHPGKSDPGPVGPPDKEPETRRWLRPVPDDVPAAPAGDSGRSLVKGEFRVLAVLSVVVGAMLLMENFGFLAGVHRLWPVFPGFAGAGLVLVFFRRRRRDLVMMGIGSYLLGVSALFMVCNYSSWSILLRAWPVFVALLGSSSVLASIFARRGKPVLWMSGTFLLAGALVLFLVFGVNPTLWPVSLILFGAWILLITWARRREPSGRVHEKGDVR